MNTTTKYIHDRAVLLLLSINAFLALASSIFMILQLSARHPADYIVQCRDCSNIAYVGRFTHGGIGELLSFIVFAFLVLAVHITLSVRTYRINRQLSVVILGLGVFLLVTTIIVSNALLVLRGG